MSTSVARPQLDRTPSLPPYVLTSNSAGVSLEQDVLRSHDTTASPPTLRSPPSYTFAPASGSGSAPHHPHDPPTYSAAPTQAEQSLSSTPLTSTPRQSSSRSSTARRLPPEDLLAIDHTVQTRADRSNSDFFERKFDSGCVTVIVDGQDIRGYSVRCGGAPLEGKIVMAEHIMDLNGVLGVDIKLEGTIQLTMPNGDHRTHPLANDVHSVYRTENSSFDVANSSTALSLQQSCPEILPFSIPCPSSTALPSYQDSLTESRQQASEVNASFFAGDLPPTLNIPLHNSACMIRHVTVVYSLVLTIWLRRLGSRVPLGPGTCMIERGDAATAPPKARFKKQFSIPVIYRPRARPQSPAIQRLSTITTQPDRWREVSWRTKQLGRGTSVTSQPLTVKLTIPAPFIFTAFQRLPFHLHVDCHSTALKEHLLRQDPNTPRFELEVSLIREFIVEPPMQYSTSSRYRGVRRAVLGKSQLTMVENPAESTVVAWAGAIVWLKGNSTFAGFGSFEGNVLSAEDRIVVAVRHLSTINTKETSVLRGLFQVRGSGKPDEVQEFSQDVRVITDLPGAEATQ